MLSRTSTSRRHLAAAMAVVVLALIAPLADALMSPADAALSATCKAWKVKIERFGWDPNYASANCTAIGATTQVRAKLDVNADSDRYSVWFIRTKRTFSSPSINCVWGCSATYQKSTRP